MPALKEPERRLGARFRAERLFDTGGEPTLDDRVIAVLESAARGRTMPCPVCEGPLASSSPGAVLECAACGSRLE